MKQPAVAKRVTIQFGTTRKEILVTRPPFPMVGDVVTYDELDWNVTAVRDEEIIAAFRPIMGKLKRVSG